MKILKSSIAVFWARLETYVRSVEVSNIKGLRRVKLIWILRRASEWRMNKITQLKSLTICTFYLIFSKLCQEQAMAGKSFTLGEMIFETLR